jgi:ABC-2 type transport system ATP-binding protein
VADAADRHYETLSGGQQRRTCVATALVNDPDLLVLDEPTTGVDPAGRRALWTLLEGLSEAGTTILLTTHYMAEAERLADRVGLLADGNLVAVDSPASLVERHGGDALLAVECPDPPASVTDRFADASLENGRLTVRDVAPEEIGEVAQTLDGHGVAYESLTWREPDLEDVYLELAGQSVDADSDARSGDADGRARSENGSGDARPVDADSGARSDNGSGDARSVEQTDGGVEP